MPHELLEREDIVKNTNYNLCNPIATVLSAVEELLEFADITRKSYTQLQAVNIAYVIIHRTVKFGLAICDWDCMPEIQKTWVRFKHFFWTSHQELRETSKLTVEDTGMNHANMVRDVVAGLQEALRQEKVHTKTLKGCARACRSCGKRGAKHPTAVGHTAAANVSDYAGDVDAICCSASGCMSRLCMKSRQWRTWIPR